MAQHGTVATNEVVAGEWVAFQGGELEGRRPKAMCVACRDRLAWRGDAGSSLEPRAEPPDDLLPVLPR